MYTPSTNVAIYHSHTIFTQSTSKKNAHVNYSIVLNFCEGINCQEIKAAFPTARNNVYTNLITNERMYCDMDSGGYTVIQKRGDNGKPEDYFYRNWNDYVNGFGEVGIDFWIGLENMHM